MATASSNRNTLYIHLCLASILTLGIVLLCTDRGALHLFLAGHHTSWADHFFRYFTYIGAYGVYIVTGIWLLMGYRREALLLLGSELCSGLIVQLIKHIVRAPRPLTWFAEHMPEVSLPLAEGQQMAYWLSFPSGHTASCFVLCFFLSSIYRHPAWQTACLVLAWLGAYSRIYLQMHFAEDVFAGALVGTTVAYFVNYTLQNKGFWEKYAFFRGKNLQD